MRNFIFLIVSSFAWANQQDCQNKLSSPESIVDFKTDAFYFGHKVRGVPLFPGAGWNDLALQVIKNDSSDRLLKFKKMKLKKPLYFTTETKVTVELEGMKLNLRSGDTVHVEVSGISTSREDSLGEMTIENDLKPVDLSNLYSDLEKIDLNYGPDFRKLTSLARSSSGILRGSVEYNLKRSHTSVPGEVLDSALHGLAAHIMLTIQEYNLNPMTYVPVMFKDVAFDTLVPLTDIIRFRIVMDKPEAVLGAAQLLTFSLELANDQGQIFYRIEDGMLGLFHSP